MTDEVSLLSSYFTDDQTDCILDFAAQVSGSLSAVRRIGYKILGTANLAEKDQATDLLRSLQGQDWSAAARHGELAGANNLLVAILLHIDADGGQLGDYWVAMRSPFEYLDSASLVAWGRIDNAPQVAMSGLPLANTRGKKS
jgi:hypothetical protein